MKKVIIALMMLTVCGTSVFAGEWKKEGSVLLGLAMPSGDAGDTVDSGMAFGLDYDGYKINDMWSIGGAFSYISSPEKTTAGIDYTLSAWGVSPHAKYSTEVAMGSKKLNVYGLAGLGLYSVTAEASALGVTVEATDSKFGFNLGGGADVEVAQNILLGLEVRWHHVFSAQSVVNDDGTTGKNAVNNITPALKIAYVF